MEPEANIQLILDNWTPWSDGKNVPFMQGRVEYGTFLYFYASWEQKMPEMLSAKTTFVKFFFIM
jgi:hypothetical protein